MAPAKSAPQALSLLSPFYGESSLSFSAAHSFKLCASKHMPLVVSEAVTRLTQTTFFFPSDFFRPSVPKWPSAVNYAPSLLANPALRSSIDVMAHIENGHTNGFGDSALNPETLLSAARFSDIPSAIDIPASTFDSEVEVSLEELPDDPTELCTLLENEKAAKNFWVIISLAYAKQNQLDHAVEILQKGLASVAHGATKEKLGLLNWLCWLLMLKSRQAPRVAPDGDSSGVKTKDHYLQLATSTLNEASRLNPAYTPLFLARGVLSLLRASLYPPRPVRTGISDNSERVETLRQALKCFEEASKASGGRNVMAYLGLARSQYSLGNYPDALLTYQTVLTRMPGLTDPDPRIGIGCCLWQLGFKERAKDAWERALSLVSNKRLVSVISIEATNNSPFRTRTRKLQIC